MIPGFHCQGLGSILGQETKILQVAWHGQKKKKVMDQISFDFFS